MLVRERRRPGADTAARRIAVDGVEAAPPVAGQLAGVEQHPAQRRDEQPQPHRATLAAELEHVRLQLGEVAMRLARPRLLELDVDEIVALGDRRTT